MLELKYVMLVGISEQLNGNGEFCDVPPVSSCQLSSLEGESAVSIYEPEDTLSDSKSAASNLSDISCENSNALSLKKCLFVTVNA